MNLNSENVLILNIIACFRRNFRAYFLKPSTSRGGGGVICMQVFCSPFFKKRFD